MASATIILSASQLLSALVAVVFSILVARLLGPGGYGLVNLALVYPSLLAGLLDLGIGTVVSRYAAANGVDGLGHVWSGVVLKLLLGFIGSLIVFLYADFFAGLLMRPDLAPLLSTLSLYVFASAALSAVSSAYVGFGRYALAGSVSLALSTLRGVFAVALILAGLGVFGAVASFTIAYTLLSVLYLLLFLKFFGRPRLSREAVKDVIRLSLPLYLATLAGLLVPPMVDTLVARQVSDTVIGNYKVAMISATPIAVITSSVSTAALTSLPLLLGDEESLRNGASSYSLYASVALTGLMLGYMAVQPWLIILLYGSSYSLAASYANIYVAGFLADAVLGSYILGSHFITVGATRWNGLVATVRGATVILAAMMLVKQLGAAGAMLSYSIGELVAATTIYFVASRVYSVRIDLRGSLKGLIPALASFAAASAVAYWINSTLASLLASGLIFVILYLLLLPFFLDDKVLSGLVGFLTSTPYIGWLLKPFGEVYLSLTRELHGRLV